MVNFHKRGLAVSRSINPSAIDVLGLTLWHISHHESLIHKQQQQQQQQLYYRYYISFSACLSAHGVTLVVG